MATVFLPPSLEAQAQGDRPLKSSGDTVREALLELERRHPALRGWILNEQGHLRSHVALFLDQDRVALESRLESGDELHVVQAISGGGLPTPTTRSSCWSERRKACSSFRALAASTCA